MNGHERRRFPRVTVSVDVDFTSGSNFYAGKTRDVSEGGLFIESPVSMPIGSTMDLHLHFLDKTHEVKAEVAWVLADAQGSPLGFGVHFVELRRAVRKAILAFMVLRDPMVFDLCDAAEDDVLQADDGPAREPMAATHRGPPPLPPGC